MGSTLWTDPQTGIEEWIEDENPIYTIAGTSLHALSLLEDGQDPATADGGDGSNVLDDLVKYFGTLDAGVPVVGTDANGVWPSIKFYADLVPAARVVVDQHRTGIVSPAAYKALADAVPISIQKRQAHARSQTTPPKARSTRRTFDRGTGDHASHDA